MRYLFPGFNKSNIIKLTDAVLPTQVIREGPQTVMLQEDMPSVLGFGFF